MASRRYIDLIEYNGISLSNVQCYFNEIIKKLAKSIKFPLHRGIEKEHILFFMLIAENKIKNEFPTKTNTESLPNCEIDMCCRIKKILIFSRLL